MEIKIQMPNPDDYQGSYLDWFTQMRNVLKAAEKIYEQEISGLTSENKSNVWVDLEIEYPESEDVDNATSLEVFMSDRKYLEKLYLRIASL